MVCLAAGCATNPADASVTYVTFGVGTDALTAAAGIDAVVDAADAAMACAVIAAVKDAAMVAVTAAAAAGAGTVNSLKKNNKAPANEPTLQHISIIQKEYIRKLAKIFYICYG